MWAINYSNTQKEKIQSMQGVKKKKNKKKRIKCHKQKTTATAAHRGIYFNLKQKPKSHFSLKGVSETRFYYPL